MVSSRCDGAESKVPAREVVPGDVILLHTGDRIPADARLLEAINLQVEEAALTGESVLVEKHTRALEKDDLPMGDRKNLVYAGTAVTYGRGRALVLARAASVVVAVIVGLGLWRGQPLQQGQAYRVRLALRSFDRGAPVLNKSRTTSQKESC